MNRRRSLLSSFAVVAIAALGACSSPQQDQPIDAGPPQPLGPGDRLSQVMNPASPKHPASATKVGSITGVSFLLVDTFPETTSSSSTGTVYVQDTGSSAPYSGASIFEPTYLPASFKPAPGDVLDLADTEFDALSALSSTSAPFPSGELLVQLAKPTITFRFEYEVPAPTPIDVTDLNDYAKGDQWLGMLVVVTNITLGEGLQDSGGRATAYLTSQLDGSAVEMSNELFDLAAWNNAQTKKLVSGAKISSLTGIVTWFDQYHIAPRSPADIVME